MIDGMWWLVILLAIVIALWLFAKSRGAISDDNTSNSTAHPTNDTLQKTLKLIQRQFPNYRAIRKANHLLISENNKKIAMITIDKKLAVGQRVLGEVTIINYHSVPNSTQLVADFKQVK